LNSIDFRDVHTQSDDHRPPGPLQRRALESEFAAVRWAAELLSAFPHCRHKASDLNEPAPQRNYTYNGKQSAAAPPLASSFDHT
jgi:hypothetical protein